ncbi:MAG: hypothetical protein AABZ77_08815, partial [Chloroflexota bacterium]
MKAKATRGKKFEEKTDFKASATWHKNFDVAMFGGSDIGTQDYEAKQLNLESMFKSIERRR